MDKKEKIILISILIIAFILRIVGINYGLPNFFIGDEQALIGGSLKMIELKTLIPSLYPEEFRLLYYPPLISYFYFLFFVPVVLIKYLLIGNLSLLKINFILNPSIFILLTRFLSVLFGTATIYLIYLIGKRLFSKKTALFASLFLTFSFLHLQLSHMARHWIFDLFFCYLIILLSLQLIKRKTYFFIGILAGLAFGSSYLSAISLIIPLIIHFTQPLPFDKKIKDKNLWIMLIIFLMIAILFIILHSPAFFRISIGEKSSILMEKSLISYLKSFSYYFNILFKIETILLVFSLIGFLILFFRNRKIFYIFIFFIFFYITILYFLFHHESRYIFLVLPIFCLAAGLSLDSFTERFSKFLSPYQKFWYGGLPLIIIFFALPFIVDLKYDFLLSKKDSRVLAKNWIEKNIGSQNKIASYLESIKLIPTRNSILEQEKIDSQGLRSLEKELLTLEDKNYPQPAFYILPLHFIAPENLPNLKEYLKENNYQYFLIDYWNEDEISSREKEIIDQSKLIEKFGDIKPIDINGNYSDFVFKLFNLKRCGPIVEIYKINL